MKTENYIQVCPQCGSTNVSRNSGIEAAAFHYANTVYKCDDCGFFAQAFPEMTKDNIKKFRKQLEIKNDNN